MNDLAHPMHIVKTNEALPGKSPHQRKWHSLVVISLDDLQEVDSQNLKHHDEMLPVWTMVDEGVKQLGAVGTLGDHAEFGKSAHQVLVVLVVTLD